MVSHATKFETDKSNLRIPCESRAMKRVPKIKTSDPIRPASEMRSKRLASNRSPSPRLVANPTTPSRPTVITEKMAMVPLLFDHRNRTAGRGAPSHSISPSSAIERPSRVLHIARDLRRELGRARERDLVAKALHERHLDLLAVQVATKVKQVRLEHALASAERRTNPERCRRLEPTLPHLRPHRVDAVAPQQPLALKRQIARGASKSEPATPAVDYPSADAASAAP